MSECTSTIRSRSVTGGALGLFRSAMDRLGSVRFAVSVIVLITVACAIGTLLPQGGEVRGFLRENPGATGLIRVADRAGLTHVFSSWWFLTLLGLFAASLARCGTRRLLVMRRTTGPARWRAFGSFLTHLSLLLLFAGGVARVAWGERGVIEFREGETATKFRLEGGLKDLPFSIYLHDFSIETYGSEPSALQADIDATAATSPGELYVQWSERSLSVHLPVELNSEKLLAPPGEQPRADNSWRIRMEQYVPDFVVDSTTGQVSSRSNQPANPALLVAVSGPDYASRQWVFARFPDRRLHTGESENHGESPLRLMFHASAIASAEAATSPGPIKSFRSAIRVLENDSVVHEKIIEVNRPFRYRGYTFFQLGYNPKDPAWTSLQVVRDPGVLVVYAGFTLLMAGLFTVFYLTPWLARRKEKA